MSKSTLAQKRGSNTQHSVLPANEQKIYDLIWSRKDKGIWTADIKREAGLPDAAVNKAVKSLRSKNLIKDIQDVNKGRKVLMAIEFEPSDEVTGGSWYTEGRLDTELISILRMLCVKCIEQLEVAKLEDVTKSIEDSSVLKSDCSEQQIIEIVRSLVLDKEIEEIKSTGVGVFSAIPPGKTCYRSLKGRRGKMENYLSSIPCGVCPRISECTPGGIISPTTCVYYTKWLNLEF